MLPASAKILTFAVPCSCMDIVGACPVTYGFLSSFSSSFLPSTSLWGVYSVNTHPSSTIHPLSHFLLLRRRSSRTDVQFSVSDVGCLSGGPPGGRRAWSPAWSALSKLWPGNVIVNVLFVHDILSARSSFFFCTPSAFHWRMLSVLGGSGCLALLERRGLLFRRIGLRNGIV